MDASIIPKTFGAELIAALLQTWLHGILTFQYGQYFTSGFKDPFWTTYPLAVLYIMNTFHAVSIAYMVWYYTIEHFGDPSTLLVAKLWPFQLSAILTTCSAVVTQLFLTYRAYRLTKRILWVIPLLVLTIAAFICGITIGIKVWMLPSLDELSTLNPFLTAWLSLEVSADWVIAGVLFWELRKSKTSFRHTDQIINRMLRTAVQTGFVATVFASMTMALFLALPNTEFVLITGAPIGCVYTATLMDTLLSRKSLRDMIRSVELGSMGTGSANVNPHSTKSISSPTVAANRIRVHKEQETVIHFDPTSDGINGPVNKHEEHYYESKFATTPPDSFSSLSTAKAM